MDDVIKLLTAAYSFDAAGNEILTQAEREVFCRVRSVSRAEFYQAAQNDLHPGYVFILSNYKDYQGEQELLYTDWTETTRRYSIVRTYRNVDTDELEIVTEERIGQYGESGSTDGEGSE